ncbi:MAG: hypothetical protein ACW980_24910 [Promethearchaeota archaeon]
MGDANITSKKEDKLKIPIELQERIEKIVLRILYDEKSVKSSRLLMEKVLERATKERITVSDKTINTIIQQMSKNKKINFTQSRGWTIRI